MVRAVIVVLCMLLTAGCPAKEPIRLGFVGGFGQEPGFADLAGYDAARIAIDVLSLRKPGQSVKSAVLAISSFHGVQNMLQIDRFGDSNRPSHVAEVRGGAYHTVQ